MQFCLNPYVTPLKTQLGIWTALGLASFSLLSCSSTRDLREIEPTYEYYYPAQKQLPAEAVYSRVTWNYLPEPIKLQSNQKAPYLQPVISFEMPDSTLAEAIAALAQTLGYGFDYPKALGSRKISLNLVGTPEQILAEINRQAGVQGELDIKRRFVQVTQTNIGPKLEKNTTSNKR